MRSLRLMIKFPKWAQNGNSIDGDGWEDPAQPWLPNPRQQGRLFGSITEVPRKRQVASGRLHVDGGWESKPDKAKRWKTIMSNPFILGD